MNSDSDQNGVAEAAAGESSQQFLHDDPKKTSPALSARELEAEALAEEEFVSDFGEKLDNPLVSDDYDLLFSEEAEVASVDNASDEKLSGSITSGEPEKKPAFNNEQALRDERKDEAKQAEVDAQIELIEAAKKSNEQLMEKLDKAGLLQPTAEQDEVKASSVETTADVSEPAKTDEAVKTAEFTKAAAPTVEVAADASTVEVSSTSSPVATPLSSAPQATAPVVSSAEGGAKAAKKPKKGLIVALVVILGIALTAGAIFLFSSFAFKPEAVIDKSIERIMGSKELRIGGQTQIKLAKNPESEAKEFEAFERQLDLSHNLSLLREDKKAQFTISADRLEDPEGKSLSLDSLELKVASEGDKQMVRVNNISKLRDGIVAKPSESFAFIDPRYENVLQHYKLKEQDVDSFVAEHAKTLGDKMLSDYENKWVVLDEGRLKGRKKELYEAMLKGLDELRTPEARERIAQLYQQNPFATMPDRKDIKRDGGEAEIEFKIDKVAFERFSVELKKDPCIKAISDYLKFKERGESKDGAAHIQVANPEFDFELETLRARVNLRSSSLSELFLSGLAGYDDEDLYPFATNLHFDYEDANYEEIKAEHTLAQKDFNKSMVKFLKGDFNKFMQSYMELMVLGDCRAENADPAAIHSCQEKKTITDKAILQFTLALVTLKYSDETPKLNLEGNLDFGSTADGHGLSGGASLDLDLNLN